MAEDAPEIGLVLDCSDPARLAEFWGPALGYVNLGTVGSYVALFPDGRPGPKLLLQKVPEAKVTKNRFHLDVEVADLQAVGGSVVQRRAPIFEERGHLGVDRAEHDQPTGDLFRAGGEAIDLRLELGGELVE